MAYTIKFSSGPTFTFLAFQTPNGAPLAIARLLEEGLETPGVSGRRWRTVHQQHEAFELHALAAATDFAAAVALANSYLSARLVSQIVTLTDGSITLPNVHVASIVPVARPGGVVGTGSNGEQASVFSTWLLEYTVFPSATR